MKLFRTLFVACMFILLVAACAPIANQFVPLPETERVGVTALAVAVVGWLFALIGRYLPWSTPFLEKYKMEISLVLAGVLIGYIENALPSAYPAISILIVQLVLAILAAVGVISTLTKAGVKGLRP